MGFFNGLLTAAVSLVSFRACLHHIVHLLTWGGHHGPQTLSRAACLCGRTYLRCDSFVGTKLSVAGRQLVAGWLVFVLSLIPYRLLRGLFTRQLVNRKPRCGSCGQNNWIDVDSPLGSELIQQYESATGKPITDNAQRTADQKARKHPLGSEYALVGLPDATCC